MGGPQPKGAARSQSYRAAIDGGSADRFCAVQRGSDGSRRVGQNLGRRAFHEAVTKRLAQESEDGTVQWIPKGRGLETSKLLPPLADPIIKAEE